MGDGWSNFIDYITTQNNDGDTILGDTVNTAINTGSAAWSNAQSNKAAQDLYAAQQYQAEAAMRLAEIERQIAENASASQNTATSAFNSFLYSKPQNNSSNDKKEEANTKLIFGIIIVAALGFVGYKQGWFK